MGKLGGFGREGGDGGCSAWWWVESRILFGGINGSGLRRDRQALKMTTADFNRVAGGVEKIRRTGRSVDE